LSDPYLEITTESAKKTLRKTKTKVIDKTLNPTWNEVLELYVVVVVVLLDNGVCS